MRAAYDHNQAAALLGETQQIVVEGTEFWHGVIAAARITGGLDIAVITTTTAQIHFIRPDPAEDPMLETLLRDVDAADLNAFARTMQTSADFELTRTVMPERRLNSVKFRIKSSKRRVNAAKFRAYNAQTAVARRQAEKIITEGMPPPLGQKLIVGELEQILLGAARGADSSEFVELRYDDIERHVESIHNRMELAAGDLLLDGKFTLSGENDLTLEADFGVLAANMPTAAKPWSDPTSVLLADELRWHEGQPGPQGQGPRRHLGSVGQGR